MADFYGLLNTLYKKDKANVTDDVGTLIGLTRTLSKDPDNALALKKAVPFMFYLEPLNYYYLLYSLIPKKAYIPKLIKTEKSEEKDNEIFNTVKRVFNWSERELRFSKSILEKVMTDKEYWEKEFGL